MKKFITIMITVAMMFSFCNLYFATSESQSMVISTRPDSEFWHLSYPADAQVPWKSTEHVIGTIKSEEMLLNPGKCIEVSVSSSNDYNFVNETKTDSKISYTLKGADSILFLPGEAGKEYKLSVAVNSSEWKKAAAGEHKDMLTFTAAYKDAV